MKKYFVWKAVENAEQFRTGDGVTDRRAMQCYEDCIDVGEFLTDKEAIEAVQELQRKADENARQVLASAGFSDDLGGCGASYVAHLFREEVDGDVQVEL